MTASRTRQRLLRAWRVVSHVGVHPLHGVDSRPIVATNQFAVLASVVVVPYAAFVAATSWPDLVQPALAMLALAGAWMFCLLLNARGSYLAASTLSLLSPIVAAAYLTSFFTTASGFHYMLFAGGVLSFAVFRPEQWLMRATFIGISIATLIFCEGMWPPESFRYSFDIGTMDWLRGINISLTVLLLYLLGRFDLHYYERERERNAALLEAAQVAAQTDALTDVYNRRGIAPVLSAITRRSDYALGLVDLDRFKLINDRLGHGAGDVVLANAARTLVRSVGDNGKVARWGGEEFLVVLPGMSLIEADALMEQVREDMEHEYGAPESLARVTISVGLAHAPRYASKEEVLRLADANLYEAKSSGRNVVVSARLAPDEE